MRDDDGEILFCPPKRGYSSFIGGGVVNTEEMNNVKAVCFVANCDSPETQAWSQLREWTVRELNDYEARRYIGFAPRGHHPAGEGSNFHEYKALMLLDGAEGSSGLFHGMEVIEAPKGLFFVGDVMLNQFHEDGTLDLGTSMRESSKVICEFMLNMGEYDMDFDGRTHLEEHIFPKEWFEADDPSEISIKLKLWLPVKVK